MLCERRPGSLNQEPQGLKGRDIHAPHHSRRQTFPNPCISQSRPFRAFAVGRGAVSQGCSRKASLALGYLRAAPFGASAGFEAGIIEIAVAYHLLGMRAYRKPRPIIQAWAWLMCCGAALVLIAAVDVQAAAEQTDPASINSCIAIIRSVRFCCEQSEKRAPMSIHLYGSQAVAELDLSARRGRV